MLSLSKDYFEIKKNGLSPAQNFACYLGGSVSIIFYFSNLYIYCLKSNFIF